MRSPFLLWEVLVIKNEIVNHVEAVLPSYCVPHRIMIIDHLPMTPIGKIDYKELERKAIEKYI